MLRRFSLFFVCLAICLCFTSCGSSIPTIQMEDLTPDMQAAYRSKMQEKMAESPANHSYALYDINQDGTPDLFVGWARKLDVYEYRNGTLLYLGNIYNEPFASTNGPGVYTYGGFGTGTGGSAFFAINSNKLQKSNGEVNLQYLISQGQSVFLINGKNVSEDTYNAKVDQHFNNQTRIPIHDIP